MKKITKILFLNLAFLGGLFALNNMPLQAIEKSVELNGSTLRAYIWIAENGGSWESSGRHYSGHGVTHLSLHSNVPGLGYFREPGSATYAEDGGVRAGWRSGGYARVYAFSGNVQLKSVATAIY